MVSKKCNDEADMGTHTFSKPHQVEWGSCSSTWIDLKILEDWAWTWPADQRISVRDYVSWPELMKDIVLTQAGIMSCLPHCWWTHWAPFQPWWSNSARSAHKINETNGREIQFQFDQQKPLKLHAAMPQVRWQWLTLTFPCIQKHALITSRSMIPCQSCNN